MSSRRAILVIPNPLNLATHSPVYALNRVFISSRQLSQRPEGSPSNWTDDIRAGPGGTPTTTAAGKITPDQHVRVINRHDNNPDYREEEDGMERAKERTRDAAHVLSDLAKEGTAKAIESGLELGEIAKKTMDVAWDAAKDTANNLKDAITGDDERRDHRHRNRVNRNGNESGQGDDARFKKPAAGGYH
ncbi:OLC1v1023101C1 [Oldenlandia corymbosa var. corymbosa]|uniref:OLC1v1023101C1 n=1 Tax=Oldenlandia corymbosa var. corymbosa TaxID=529605 RepID=A0AAV1BZI1_OLDCO|nr:OLC1v1023101C1 [Oldenlandia corymbosa var. corymbosa]